MTTHTLFRKGALQRPSSLQSAHEGLQLIAPGARLASYTALAACLAGLLLAIFTTVPIHLEGPGILLEESGVGTLTADTSGRVVKLRVGEGSKVRKGDIVADVAAEDLSAEVLDAQSVLATAQLERKRGEDSIDRLRAARKAHDESRAAAAKKLIAIESDNLEGLKKRHAARENLAKDGFLSPMSLIDSEQEVIASRRRLDELRAPLQNAELEERTRQAEEAQRLLDLGIKVEDAQRRVDELAQRLERTAHVRSVRDGIVASLRVEPGDVVRPDSEIATITPLDDQGKLKGSLLAYIFVNAETGSQIRPGMQARVVPAAIKPSEYGYMDGSVRNVSTLPQGPEELMLLLRNRSLVESLSREGAPVRVDIELKRGETPSGYHWTSSRGPSMTLKHGTELKGRVEVRYERVIHIALPFLKRYDK